MLVRDCSGRLGTMKGPHQFGGCIFWVRMQAEGWPESLGFRVKVLGLRICDLGMKTLFKAPFCIWNSLRLCQTERHFQGSLKSERCSLKPRLSLLNKSEALSNKTSSLTPNLKPWTLNPKPLNPSTLKPLNPKPLNPKP